MVRRFEERWAIYFVPQPDELLARLVRIWFSAHGRTPYLAWPQQYGFHATLKAPFYMTAAGLLLSALRLSMRLDSVVLPSLRAVAMGRYLALTPEQPCPAVAALAQSLVVGLDFFRVPAQRHWAGLTPRQRQNARRWGYPWPDLLRVCRWRLCSKRAAEFCTTSPATRSHRHDLIMSATDSRRAVLGGCAPAAWWLAYSAASRAVLLAI